MKQISVSETGMKPLGEKSFKIKLLQNGFNTYNEALLNMIKNYKNNGKNNG